MLHLFIEKDFKSKGARKGKFKIMICVECSN